MTPRQIEIRAKVAKAMALNPAIRPEIADHLIAAGASLVETGSTLFTLVCGGSAVKGDCLDISRAFELDGDPFSCAAACDVSVADTEIIARN